VIAAIPVLTLGAAIGIVFALVAGGAVAVQARGRAVPRGMLAARLTLVFIVAVLLGYTLPHWDPSAIQPPVHMWNLVPFRTISSELAGLDRYPAENALQLFGNVAFFMPIGLLLPLGWRRARRLPATIVVGLALTVAIELTQLVMTYTLTVDPRWADIDDVMLNLLGVVLGWGVWRLAVGLERTRARGAS
jgi:glycopeptide antibiotics resistance protein